MIIKDKTHDGCYTTINNRIVKDQNLSLKAKGLLLCLLSRPPTWKIYKEELMGSLNEGRRVIDSTFKELSQSGYLKLENGEWVVYETPREKSVQNEQQAEEDAQNVQSRCTERTSQDVQNVQTDCTKCTTDGVHNVQLVKKDNKKEGRKESKEELPPPPSSFSKEEGINQLLESRFGLDETFKEKVNNNPSITCSNETELNDQALQVLRQHPSRESASRALPDVKEAILEHGFNMMLSATQAYANEIKESGKKPSWPSYWYKEEQFLFYFPEPEVPIIPREFTRPAYLTPEMEEWALDDMTDAVTTFYRGNSPRYVRDPKDDAHFLEAGRLCLYRDLNPFQLVCFHAGDSHRERIPALLHAEEAEANLFRQNPSAAVPNVNFCCNYIADVIEKCKEVVAIEIEKHPSKTFSEILLDPDIQRIPAWYRVVALGPEDPNFLEVVDRWSRQAMLDIYYQQITGLVEALFRIEDIFAANLFPYYAKRFENAAKYVPAPKIEAPRQVDPVLTIQEPERVEDFTLWYENTKGCSPTPGLNLPKEDVLAYLNS